MLFSDVSSIQRVGLYPVLTQDEANNLSPSEQMKLKKKMTPKHFRTFAAKDASGEAGYYVELEVFGGIVSMQNDKCASYLLSLQLHSIDGYIVAIATSNTYINSVSMHAVRQLRSLGLCQLVSLAAPPLNPTPLSPTPIRDGQGPPVMLCDSDDEELLFPNRCPREYAGMNFLSTCCYHSQINS